MQNTNTNSYYRQHRIAKGEPGAMITCERCGRRARFDGNVSKLQLHDGVVHQACREAAAREAAAREAARAEAMKDRHTCYSCGVSNVQEELVQFVSYGLIEWACEPCA